MFKAMVTALTAQNATETNKTLIDTITVPQGVKHLVGVGVQMVAKGLTTLESCSCIVELESDDMSPWGCTQQFISGLMNPVGAVEVANLQPFIHPCMIDVTPGSHIKFSTTFDMALTITPSVRGQLYFDT